LTCPLSSWFTHRRKGGDISHKNTLAYIDGFHCPFFSPNERILCWILDLKGSLVELFILPEALISSWSLPPPSKEAPPPSKEAPPPSKKVSPPSKDISSFKQGEISYKQGFRQADFLQPTHIFPLVGAFHSIKGTSENGSYSLQVER